jgi:competence/damage-inducible protein CinA-like protein
VTRADRPRAVVLITGSELVRGERTDLNGPFLATEVLSLGLEPARITIVGDRPEELEAALREGLEADLCVISGGLGPTHDDRTIELLAHVAGRELIVDNGLAAEIEAISRRIAERLRRPYADFEAGVVKQATLPDGARALGIAGTAPGVVLQVDGCVAVSLPGPPPELQRLWRLAVQTPEVRAVLVRGRPPGRRVLRFYGASESAVARALADAGGDGDGVEATICARDFEIHVDLLVDEAAEPRAAELAAALRRSLERYLFVEDERPVEELVLALCRARGLSLATAESCTGGLVAARLTSVPGSSDAFVGGVVAYSNELKVEGLGVDPMLVERHGAVSSEVAAAMASGVRTRIGADVAVAVTGVAGPGGGTPEKPVGLVFLHAATPEGERGLRFDFPGDRESIRSRAAVAALHLVRRLLTQSRDS